MFRSAKWKSEKNRIKAVFKLHFNATQVLQSGVDALVLSIVPGDIGRPTKRLEKATVRDGNCRWENPVYETIKYFQDPKTGKIGDKIYNFLLSTGLSKASAVGEVSINFADYVDSTKPSSVSLPVRNSHCDAVLHVSIQRLQDNGDQIQREEDECEDPKLKIDDRSLRNKLNNGDTDENTKSYFSEDVSNKPIINRTSSVSDTTLSSSDDSSGVDTPCKIGLRKTNIDRTTNQFVPVMHRAAEPPNTDVNTSTPMHDLHERSQWGWSSSSELGLSTGDSTNGSHNSLSKETSQEASHSEIERLKAEHAALARHVDVSDMELQTLRKQIVKESKRGQDLSKEIIILKDERDALKTECDNIRSFHKRMDDAKARNRSQLENGDHHAFVEEIRQELSYEKDTNANLRLQLKKMQESNAELVLAVQDLEEMLEQKNSDMRKCNNSNKHEHDKNSRELEMKLSKCETDDDEDQKALDELVKEKSGAKETDLLEKKIIDLYGEIEMYRRDKEELEMQIEQIALDYEILKQENHSIANKLEQSQLQEQLNMQCECSNPPAAMNDIETHIENLENELKEQSEDFSNSLATIKVLETHIRRLEEETEKQAQGFEADIEAVAREKVEQEQRAIQAEETLRKTRQKNANTAERLQEEFQRLSMQMTSTFDENEKATMKALTEASELRLQKNLVEGMLHKVQEELQLTKADYEVKLNELSNQIDTMTVQIQQMVAEIEDKSKQLENQKKFGEQVNTDFSEEIEILKSENEKLMVEISRLNEQVEGKEILQADLELMRKSIEEYETLLHQGTVERNELASTIASLKKEAEHTLNEINKMRNQKDEKEAEARLLKSELEAVRAQCSDLKQSLFEDEAEKEKLRKQISQLKSEIKKKGDALTSIEKRFRDTSGRNQLSDGTKTSPINKKTASSPQNSKEMASMREKIKMLEGLVKSKETALETSTTSSMKKEKELQSRIMELENKVEEVNRNFTLHEDRSVTDSNEISEELRNRLEQADNNLSDVLIELSSLKERNKSMESELKEMQERYSEMSLKFAEVEGERQILVMTVRNLKSFHKG
ncbi:intracellular protein transport protein USO1-like isoform X1 [Trifolium pratense]|uniref:intracellular protein transport protein USO1-like isoform X1 n=1 Tax=Trifolium pratense TaxID=57577 RepID=UPI001E693B9C|nr:intracellular protein transport protein USO1-like isoform X1 [Trifolium pratense]